MNKVQATQEIGRVSTLLSEAGFRDAAAITALAALTFCMHPLALTDEVRADLDTVIAKWAAQSRACFGAEDEKSDKSDFLDLDSGKFLN